MAHCGQANASSLGRDGCARDRRERWVLEHLVEAASQSRLRIAAHKVGGQVGLGGEARHELSARFQQEIRHAVDMVVVHANDAEAHRRATRLSISRHRSSLTAVYASGPRQGGSSARLLAAMPAHAASGLDLIFLVPQWSPAKK